MKVLIDCFAFLLAFILIVGIHEAAHACVARIFSVKIQRISLGFGHPLFKWKSKSGIDWTWSIWPLGGYVQLLNSRIQNVVPNQLKYCFDKQPTWIRCLILVAGGLANFLLAWLALSAMFMHGYRLTPPLVEEVFPNTIAAASGLATGDRFLSIAQHEVHSWQETGMRFIASLGRKNVPAIVRNSEGTIRTVNFNLSKWSFIKQPDSFLQGLGIKPLLGKIYKENIPGKPVKQALYEAAKQCYTTLFFFLVIIKQLFFGILPLSVLLGPMGLLDISGQSFLQGLSPFLSFIAGLSLSVGLINLFPFPGLDGGSIIYALIEKIRGKPISIPVEVLLHRLSMILLFIFFIQLALNDIQRYFNLV